MGAYLLTSGLFDRPRKLILTEDYLEWENRDLKGNEFTKLVKSDIVDFKHGMDWIVWYKVTVGRHFSITFKDVRNKELKIGFNSYFGRHPEYVRTYADIIDKIWTLYHAGIVDQFLDRFYDHGDAEICGVKLKRNGVDLKGDNSLIPWDKVATKDYYDYFAIYHRDDSTVYRAIRYNEYGTETLWSAIGTILKGKQANAIQ